MANFFSREKELESKLDDFPSKNSGSQKFDSDSLEDKASKPARKSKIQAEAELRQGRWVAPIILVISMIISGILWLIKSFSNP